MNRKLTYALICGALVWMNIPLVSAGESPAPANAEAYLISPKDGDVVKAGKVDIVFGLRNFGIAPAGVEKANTGHHHLLINTETPPFDEEIPNDKHHFHFGKGQTETVVELTPGMYTLELLVGDHEHIPHDNPVKSKKITITVQ